MKIQPGTTLKHYKIAAPIGAGGMGEVYRARDTNLERDVALKVLPAGLAENPQHLARLEREAKAIAALSHPNILAVYDFGSEGGAAYVVTELLEGETLRERLGRGALGSRKAAELGRQVARGLAAAHDKGIIHRDLKPENLFLTEDGRVKILDFGLATAVETGAPGDAAAGATMDLPTSTNLTSPGTVLGTVGYMSPEQVRGQATDNRSDLFSFGVVLFEMVTGRRPFQRETAPETMTAILREEPAELSSLVPDVSPALAAIIRRCLEKRAGERFHSAHDLAFSLEALSGSTISTGTAAAIADVGAPRRRPGAAVMAGLLLAGLVIGAAAAWFLRPAVSEPMDVTYTGLSSRRGTVTNARFLAGESAAVYSASWEGGPLRLYPVSENALTSEPLGFENADLLSVSSTGELALALDRRHPVGWEAVGTLAVAQPGGAAPRPLLENVHVADWAPDGQTLAVAHEVDGVVRLEYPIGTVLYESPGWISAVRVNPDGERVLIADNPGRGDNLAGVKVIHRDGKVDTVGFGGSWGVLWAPDGESILHSTGTGILRSRVGGERRTVLTVPNVAKLLDISPSGRLLIASAAVRRDMLVRAPGADGDRDQSWQDWTTPWIMSDDGRLVVFEEGNDVNRDGYAMHVRRTDGSPPLMMGYGSCLDLSPDGAWLAAVRGQFRAEQELLLMPLGPGETRRVDLHGLRVRHNSGHWIPGADGPETDHLVVLARRGQETTRLFRVFLGGAEPPQAVTPADFPLAPFGHIVSADGRRILAKPAEGAAVEFGPEGEGPRPVPGLLPGDLLLRFAEDDRHVFVQAALTSPSPIVRVDTVTGERSLWRELVPRDAAGVSILDRLYMSRDGSAYVYSTRRVVSRLMVVDLGSLMEPGNF